MCIQILGRILAVQLSLSIVGFTGIHSSHLAYKSCILNAHYQSHFHILVYLQVTITDFFFFVEHLISHWKM